MTPKVADIEQHHKKTGDSRKKGIIDVCAKSDPWIAYHGKLSQ